MKTLKNLLLGAFISMSVSISAAYATTDDDLNQDANHALQTLVASDSMAANIQQKAKAVLIFPNIVKAGLIFGGAYGEGVLKQNGAIAGYYNSFSASWGLQVGAQSYGYVVFLMNDKIVDYVRDTHGWEIGVDPTVAFVNLGLGKNLSSTTLKDDAYAFIFNQQGLMASLSIEGTKISHIEHP